MTELAFGTWPSPLAARDVAAASLRLLDTAVDGDDVYWVEGRPAEAGRCVIVRWRNGSARDVIEAPYTARTAVHEYGGGAITATDGFVYFSDGRQGQIYKVSGDGGAPARVTAPNTALRFADFVVDRRRNRLIGVCEDHSAPTVVNTIVAISLVNGTVSTLVSGGDFYSSPRLSPDGAELAWITWNFPEMPWDGTQLWTATVKSDGSLIGMRRLAGGATESIMQPRWSPDGVLHCVSDAGGWWNIHRVEGSKLVNIAPMERECARPHWNFGISSYAFLGGERVAVCSAADGHWQLHLIERRDGSSRQIPVRWTEMGAHIRTVGSRLLVDGGSPTESPGLHIVKASGEFETIWTSASDSLDESWISGFESIDFPTPDGALGHALLYRPVNPEAAAPDGALPPLLVRAHGGPTAAARTSLSSDVQYWTSRGFAVCDVNYGGSTGYGRAYRERLRGQTGCVDVDDCVAAAKYLVEQGICAADQLCISGGSAGGYVVLCALVFEPDVFAAGTSYYGVTDVEALAQDTHKFESRYYDSLIGPYATHSSLYHNRSPIHFVSRIRTPLLVLQGEDDPIVPPSQAEAMVAELRANATPYAYIAFAGEQHGFRMADTIVRALQAELAFYGRVLGFTPHDALPEVVVHGAVEAS